MRWRACPGTASEHFPDGCRFLVQEYRFTWSSNWLHSFLLSFTLCLAMQLAVVYIMVELLQRRTPTRSGRRPRRRRPSPLLFLPTGGSPARRAENLPDLQDGKLFLPPGRCPYAILQLFCFISVLIITPSLARRHTASYLVPECLILPFWAIYTAFVLFGERVVHPAGFCVMKGFVLVSAISAVGAMASEIEHSSTNRWLHVNLFSAQLLSAAS